MRMPRPTIDQGSVATNTVNGNIRPEIHQPARQVNQLADAATALRPHELQITADQSNRARIGQGAIEIVI